MKVYTVSIKIVATNLEELQDVIDEVKTCNSTNVNCEIGGVKEE